MSILSLVRDRCQKIVAIERHKFKKKGPLNILLGYFLFVAIIWAVRELSIKVWPEHIQNPARFYFIGAVVIHLGTQFISFLMYLPGYLNWLPFYQRYAINKIACWPWDRKNWQTVKQKTIYNLIMNQLFVYPLIVSSSSLIGLRQRFTDFPSFSQLISQVLIVYFIEDFFFYWAHRLFHTPALYKMHKIHHEYDKIYTFATEYFHPLDFGIANVMPSAMGFIVLGGKAHAFTFFFWIWWKVLISTEGHSGYEFPWSPMRALPLVSGPSFHDHHHSHNIGNFAGSCYFWDVMLGTSSNYWQEQLKNQ